MRADVVARPARRRFVPAALIVGLLASCQPLPHPFADDKPPADLMAIRDTTEVSVVPVAGEPAATARKLAAAVAEALRQKDIPATDQSLEPGSIQLTGRLVPQRSGPNGLSVLAVWWLRDATGHMIGQRTERLDGPASEWRNGTEQTVKRLAANSAADLASLLRDEAPAEKPGGGRIRVAIRKITGAPGDGSHSLATAVATVLQRQDLAVVDAAKAKADLYVDCDVTLTPVKPKKQHVKIVWHVRRPDGAEVGQVGQENDVPQGLLDGPWGDLAYSVAVAAGNGLGELVARGAPPPGAS